MNNRLVILFIKTFTISAFTFGGGYVIVPLMKDIFVDELGWIDENEMLDLISISQSSPGAMAVNVSMLVGYKVAGFLGSIVAIFATIIPPITVISIITLFYSAFSSNMYVANFLRGMQSGVSALIFSVVFDLSKKIFVSKDLLNYVLLFGAIILKMFFDINVVKIILLCALIGLINGMVSIIRKKASDAY